MENAAPNVQSIKRLFKFSMRKREAFFGYLFLSPWIIGFLVFLVGPMLASIYLSLTQYKMISPPVWLGLANYERMFADKLVWHSLRVTTTFTLISVPLGMVAAMAVAVLLNQKILASGVFRTIFYLPSVISGVAVALVFAWIFNYKFGILNYFLSFLNIQGPNWLGSPRYALWAFVLMSLWGIGGNVVIYLAGLQGIPQALYEAASIDGAGAPRRFFSITIPMISPTIFFVLVMSIIGSFQIFTPVFLLGGTTGFVAAAGPMDSLLFWVVYIYNQGFHYFRMGYASALAWLLFALLMALTLIQFRLAGRWVYYEGEVAK